MDRGVGLRSLRGVIGFVRSRSGWMLLVFLALSAAISGGVAGYFYHTSLQTFVAQKADENTTALELVDAFVTTYARFRSQFGPSAPVPATFRAHSIESLNKQLGSNSSFTLRWVGRQGRQIKTPPIDADMAKAIEEFAAKADGKPKSEIVTVNGQRVLRTVYPSLANEQTCVTCHNQLQPNQAQWHLNDVMGAFAIDIPLASFLQGIKTQSYTVAIGLFLALAGIGLTISILHFSQMSERESAASQLTTQNIRFNAALNNMAQGLCMFRDVTRSHYQTSGRARNSGRREDRRRGRRKTRRFEQALDREGIDAGRQTGRRTPDQSHPRSDARRRLGRDP